MAAVVIEVPCTALTPLPAKPQTLTNSARFKYGR